MHDLLFFGTHAEKATSINPGDTHSVPQQVQCRILVSEQHNKLVLA